MGGCYKYLNTKYINSYNTYNQVFDPRYLPDDFYYSKVDTYYNSAVACEALDDKNLYNLYFNDVNQPTTFIRRCNGLWMDRDYQIIPLSEVRLFLESLPIKSLIIKKTQLSEGGRNIFFWNREQGFDYLIKLFNNDQSDLIAQEIILQHEQLSKLHPSSVNTIRMLTFTANTMSKVLSAIVRIGANGSRVDNGHSGGCFCGINDEGRLKEFGYNWFTGERYDKHPTTEAIFSDSVIPNFDKCKALVEKISPRLASFSRLTSWDLSIRDDGTPVLIEVNLCYGGLFFHQIANGPIFGDNTKDIVKEILKLS